jgi:hypothetical protein
VHRGLIRIVLLVSNNCNVGAMNVGQLVRSVGFRTALSPTQALALASCYGNEWPLLIVCPAALRLMWVDEVER